MTKYNHYKPNKEEYLPHRLPNVGHLNVTLEEKKKHLDVTIEENKKELDVILGNFIHSGTGMIVESIDVNEFGQIIFKFTNGTEKIVDISAATQGEAVVYTLNSLSELPPIGREGALYIIQDEKELYFWDNENIKFKRIGFDYEDIAVIDCGDAGSRIDIDYIK